MFHSQNYTKCIKYTTYTHHHIFTISQNSIIHILYILYFLYFDYFGYVGRFFSKYTFFHIWTEHLLQTSLRTPSRIIYEHLYGHLHEHTLAKHRRSCVSALSHSGVLKGFVMVFVKVFVKIFVKVLAFVSLAPGSKRIQYIKYTNYTKYIIYTKYTKCKLWKLQENM